jgi:hypothetical protein
MLDKQINKVVKGKAGKEDVKKVVRIVEKIAEGLNLLVLVCNAKLIQSQSPLRVSVKTKRVDFKNVKSIGTEQLIDSGLETFKAWSKRKPSPGDYAQIKELFE